jgi:hypothetical protein
MVRCKWYYQRRKVKRASSAQAQAISLVSYSTGYVAAEHLVGLLPVL